MPLDRKQFLANLTGGVLSSALSPNSIFGQNEPNEIDEADFTNLSDENEEKTWARIAKKYYHVSQSFINLENGYFGVQSKPVIKAFRDNLDIVNTELARFARADYPAILLDIRKQVAAFLKVSHEEIIFTRNATEALNIAIQGYPFNPGDEVIISQLDYISMVETFQMLEKRGKLVIRQVELPLLPKTDDDIVNVYRNAITDKTRVILLTHVSNITGLIIPVKKIGAIAKEKGVDTIVDSAHALGQIPFEISDLNTDFVGMNLHKWIGNPIGAGVLYIRKHRISEVRQLYGDVRVADTDITKLAHFGTTQFAVTMTIPVSIRFHQQLGIERISKRLHYLNSIWLNAFQDHSRIETVTPVDPQYSCAIASFRVRDKPAAEVVQFLMKEHKIFTVSRQLGKDFCIRVTPSYYSSAGDMEKLVAALKSY